MNDAVCEIASYYLSIFGVEYRRMVRDHVCSTSQRSCSKIPFKKLHPTIYLFSELSTRGW